jgi:hypothetical protein
LALDDFACEDDAFEVEDVEFLIFKFISSQGMGSLWGQTDPAANG